MAYNQIYGIINEAVKEALGASAVAVIDTTSLVDVGGQILTDETRHDKSQIINKISENLLLNYRITYNIYESHHLFRVYNHVTHF